MLDIGMPEFLVIAVVALVVLGPERLPEVMRRGGQLYRQARELMAQYTAEAQRMFDEGMREVEDVSNTINSAWDSATSPDANQPPPRLRQLPPPLRQPSGAADAGPWSLPAWHREGVPAAEVTPAPALSPFALERTSASVELAPVPTDADLPDPVPTEELFIPPIPEAISLRDHGTNGTTNGKVVGQETSAMRPK